MGLTERHWFENEDVPENYEWALEDAVWKVECMNTKVDMVEVVRCKDCRWYDKKTSWCDNCNLAREQTFFLCEREKEV